MEKRKKTNEEVKKTVTELSSQLSVYNIFSSDEENLSKSDRDSMRNHNKQYDILLDEYVTNVKKSNKSKTRYKGIVFWGAIILMGVAFLVLLIMAISVLFVNKIENSIVSATTVVISFVSIYIAIPKIITKYLFNEKEEEQIAKIISSIQAHDGIIRNSLHQYIKIYDDNKDKEKWNKNEESGDPT